MQNIRIRSVMEQLRSMFWLSCGVSVVTFFALAAHAGAASDTVTVEYRYFPGLAKMDGNWAALKAASDGKVYVGLACHGCSGHLVFYDSKKDRMFDGGDLNTFTGEYGLWAATRSKR